MKLKMVNKTKNILKEYCLTSGHGSVNTMKFLILQKHKWTGIFKDIEEFTKKCQIYLREGYERVNSQNVSYYQKNRTAYGR